MEVEFYPDPLCKIVQDEDAHGMLDLIKNGYDVNERDINGETPLHYCIRVACLPKIVKLLLEAGSDANALDKWGETPICKIRILFEGRKAKYSRENIKLLVKYGADINTRDTMGQTVLYKSAFLADKRMIEMLLKLGSDPNILNVHGKSTLYVIIKPIFYLCGEYGKKNRFTAIRTLIRYGADPNLGVKNAKYFLYSEDLRVSNIMVEILEIFEKESPGGSSVKPAIMK